MVRNSGIFKILLSRKPFNFFKSNFVSPVQCVYGLKKPIDLPSHLNN